MGNPSQLRNFSAAHIRTVDYMRKHRDRVCGADVHKDLIVATIRVRDEAEIRASFGTSPPELKRFKDWLISNDCEQVAFEATGVYWIPIYEALKESIDTIVANPYQIKSIPNDKSDAKDADRISEYCMNGMIKRSRVFSQSDRDLRTLTRTRSSYVKMRTQLKNRIHKHLSSCGIKLSSCIVDIFGKSGRHILNGLVSGTETSDIIKSIPSAVIRKKEDLIRVSISKGLDKLTKVLVSDLIDFLDSIESKIEATSRMIAEMLQPKSKDLAIVMSIPGIGFVAGATILAEIGNYRDFDTPEKLTKWSGLNPGENESAGKKKSSGITKRGSKYLRTILVEVAHVIARNGNSRLSRYFKRLRARKNYNVAVIALARKLLHLVYHLLTNQELYQEEDYEIKKQSSAGPYPDAQSSSAESLDDKVAAIVDAFYSLKSYNGKSVLRKLSRASQRSGLSSRRLSDGGG